LFNALRASCILFSDRKLPIATPHLHCPREYLILQVILPFLISLEKTFRLKRDPGGKVGHGAPILQCLQTKVHDCTAVHATVIGAARHASFRNVAVKLFSNPKVACVGCFINGAPSGQDAKRLGAANVSAYHHHLRLE
jgi:hypothetical protein